LNSLTNIPPNVATKHYFFPYDAKQRFNKLSKAQRQGALEKARARALSEWEPDDKDPEWFAVLLEDMPRKPRAKAVPKKVIGPQFLTNNSFAAQKAKKQGKQFKKVDHHGVHYFSYNTDD
jgi:hypothetical protein